MKKLALLILVAAAPFAAQADGKAEAKYRDKVMEAVGGHMGSMGTILKGRVHMDNLKIHADAMAALAEIVPHTFPEGSNVGKTDAKDNIWSEPEAFKKAMDKFVKAANDMSAAAGSGDMKQIGPAIKALGGSCKGCHDDFKKD